ncbi:uncharacterized protein LOC129409727 [Boleophthalmus pectinirostris]|uniref:uncharacterized protein LOC129409727 n=1 Tax=Boleophthalmus pectinirostris TaxID=150288 RepID=UPI00242D9867|nr:uncharacterized protein LOC129409727 [Boleophthalmus pectinirostris]
MDPCRTRCLETPTPGLTLGAAPTTSLHNVTPAQTTQRTQEASEVTSSQQPQEEHNSSTLSDPSSDQTWSCGKLYFFFFLPPENHTDGLHLGLQCTRTVETPTPGLTLGAAPTTSLHNVTPAQTTQRTQEASEVTSSQQPQEEHNSSTLSVVLQYVAVSVTTILIIVSGSILIWCWKKKTNRPTEDPTAADDCEIPEMSRLYEEIPAQITPGPVENCTSFSSSHQKTTQTVYILASSAQERINQLYEEIPGSVEITPAPSKENNIYSLASLPIQQPQAK